MGNVQIHFDHSWIYISSDECDDIIDMNPSLSRRTIRILLHDTDRNSYEECPNIVVEPSATIREILRALDDLACRKMHHSMTTVDGQRLQLDDCLPEDCQQVIVETCAGQPTKDMTIRIGPDFAFSIDRAELLTFGEVVINGSHVDTIKWYNQHGTLCTFQARDDIANLITEDVDINQQPPLVLYTNPRIGIILQIVNRKMTSIDVDFIIEFVPFVEPARIGTLVNSQIDFHSVTGELGTIIDKHGAHLSSEMFCLNGMVVRQIIHVDEAMVQTNNYQPCHSLIVIGPLQFSVPVTFTQKGRQLVDIRMTPMTELPWIVTSSENVVKYTLQNEHHWNAQIANNAAYVVEYRVHNEKLLIEFHEVAVHGMTTAAQLLEAHKLLQPDDGWTLFTDKHGKELLPGCIVEVGDTIGIIDNIVTTELKSEPISPTIPYHVTDENHGSRPVVDKTQGERREKEKFVKDMYRLIEDCVADLKFLELPSNCPNSSPQSARVWLTLQHGPAIAHDEMSFYISLLSNKASVENLGVWTCQDFFNFDGKVAAILINDHWRVLYLEDKKPGLIIHWFYSYRTSDNDRKISNTFQTVFQNISTHPRSVETVTHLGVGLYGWCGFDALSDWCNYLQVVLNPQECTRLVTPLHCSVQADWFAYHTAMNHPQASTTEFALISRTEWFAHIMSRIAFEIIPRTAIGYGKEDATLKGRIAGLLIGRGHPANEAIRVSNSICKIDLPTKEANAIGSKKQSIAYPAILQLCEANGIDITCQKPAAVTKLQKFWRDKVQKKPQAIDLAMVVIPAGTFSVAGTGVDVKRTWTPTSLGVAMATKEQIQPYLAQSQRLTTQCNSVVISEPIDVKEPFSIDTHVVSVKDHWGGAALLRVYLVHMGDIKASKSPLKEVSVEADVSVEISLAAHVERWTAEQWKELIGGPVKCILKGILPQGDLQIQHVGYRRWALRRAKAKPEHSDHFSVTLTVKKTDLHRWLKKSGLTVPPVFINPRLQGNEDDHLFRVLWIGKEITAAIASTPKVPDHLGWYSNQLKRDPASDWELTKGDMSRHFQNWNQRLDSNQVSSVPQSFFCYRDFPVISIMMLWTQLHRRYPGHSEFWRRSQMDRCWLELKMTHLIRHLWWMAMKYWSHRLNQ